MLTLINFADYTNKVHPSKISIDQSISQPMSKAKFRIDDQGSQYTIRGLQEAVILDENGLANQTVNLLVNANMDIAGASTDIAGWNYVTSAPGGSAPNITENQSAVTPSTLQFDVSTCNTAGYYYEQQQILNGYIVGGQSYMASATITTSILNAAQAFLRIQFLDSNGAVLGTFTRTIISNSTARYSISGVAPAGSVSALFQFGMQVITTAGVTGIGTFSNPQLEPMSLIGQGYSYPTPLCNHLQPNCKVLPSGMTVRQKRLFSGYISRANKSYNGKKRRWDIECVSSMKLLDSTYFTATYQAGMRDEQIIAALLAFATYQIHPFGNNVQLISGNNVDSEIVMPYMAWDNVSVLQALQDIAAITGCVYFVDNYNDLNYFSSQFKVVKFGLSDTPDNVSTFAYSNFQELEDASQPKSRVTVTGGDYYPTWVDTFTGDGTTKLFTLTQNNAQSATTLTVAGVGQKVGISGQNTFTQGYNALLDTSGKINFQVAPASGAAISITYIFRTPIRTRAWDLASIQRNYGIAFDAKLDDNAILDVTTAVQRGIGEIENFADGRLSYTLETQAALSPGQIVPIYSATAGLSAVLLVQSVNIQPQGGGIVVYKVSLGEYYPDLPALLRAISLKLRPSQNNQTIMLIQDDVTWSEVQSLTFTDSFTITAHTQTTFYYGNVSSTYGYASYS